MRGVGHERALGVEQTLHAVGHLVEGLPQRALLAAALDLRAGAQIAAGDASGDALQAPQRPRDLARDHSPHGKPEREHDRSDQRQPELNTPDRGMHSGHALGHPHRPHRRPVADDRHSRREDFLAERATRALHLHLVAGKRAR